MPAVKETVTPGRPMTQKKRFTDKILVCSPANHKYVSSDKEALFCNSNRTSLRLLYKDGFRLIQIVDDGNKAIYYLEKKR